MQTEYFQVLAEVDVVASGPNVLWQRKSTAPAAGRHGRRISGYGGAEDEREAEAQAATP